MEPAIEDSHSTCASPTECNSAGDRRMKMLSGRKDHDSMAFSVGMHDESRKKKQKTSSKVNDYSDPFAITNLLDGLYYGKYGSATKDIEALLAPKMRNWNLDLAMHNRTKMLSEAKYHGSMTFSVGMHDESGKKQQKTSSKVNDHSNPFDIPNLPGGSDYSKYGSVAKDIESLLSRKMQKWNFDLVTHPAFPNNFVDVEKYQSKVVSRLPSQQANHLVHQDVIVLEDDSVSNDFAAVASPVVIIISDDDEDSVDLRPSNSFQEVVLVKPVDQCLTKDLVVRDCAEGKASTEEEGKTSTEEEGKVSTEEEGKASTEEEGKAPTEEEGEAPTEEEGEAATEEEGSLTEEEESLAGGAGEIEVRKDKGVYVGVEDYVASGEENHHTDNGDDGLADIWKEMTMELLECSKDIAGDPSSDKHAREGEEDCHHSFILKDDLGYVCRICGVIERGIETIFDFQYSKTTRTTRTYMSQSQNSKDRDPTQILLDGVKLSEDEFTITEISAHPRHRKQMKPHQVEGFNFLLSNLMADNPGGCILAHAPGSGKTFMIISFMQSFLAKYPDARPLVVLPKGILATWKKEFQTWQVEDIPLYDFYSAKADNRSQQLHVLKQWIEQKSILFLGYKQLSSIVCASGTCKTTAACREILLKFPSILILDEGHTPRNEDTDVLRSLAIVQTPRKVVLSGTLYQNHVKEVFNILNLVRPKFLKLDTSRGVVKRIMSKVNISGVRKQLKANADLAFYDLVEHTLQKDDDFRRKVTVIQDLREMTSKVLHYYKGDFLDELPGLEDFTLLLNLNPRQKPEVEKLKRLETKFKRSAVGSAVYMHPQLKYFSENSPANGDKLSIDNEKMDGMLEKLDVRDGVKAKFFLNMLSLCESTGEKLLVFSQYLLPLKFLERLTVKVKGWSPDKEIFMITGDSSSELREWSMERFNSSPDAKIFFGSIKACGEGISLVGASRIIILDVHLNPSVTRQAIGRAFRPGQKRKVHTYRLVAADSPEEEDHFTCFRKELISRMWFEWNEYCGHQDFEVKTVDVNECGDLFLESPLLRGDVKVLYKR